MKTKYNKKGSIRIIDIAKQANVSVGTVDRVLHNRGEVKEETRKKVEAMIKEMGYTPNLLAKSLALKKTYHLAVLIPEANEKNSFWEKPLHGVLLAAEEIKDFQAFVTVFKFNATNEETFVKACNEAIQSEPSGVIFNPLFRQASIDFIRKLDEEEIPYIYFDTEIEIGNNISYFGQKAKQSGYVAAKIMSRMLQSGSKILIVKLANKKVISNHLKKREEGFIEYFKESNRCDCNFHSIEIDLSDNNEPTKTLNEIFTKDPTIKAIFVPNSRVFKVADFVENNWKKELLLVGYDLINQNIEYLKKDIIDILIGQKPEDQGYKSVISLFNYIVMNKAIDKYNYSSIDIVIKENLEYYYHGINNIY